MATDVKNENPTVTVDSTDHSKSEKKEVVEFNAELVYNSYSLEKQNKIKELADSIDPHDIEAIMRFGETATQSSMATTRKFLEERKGSETDITVMKNVKSLMEQTEKKADSLKIKLLKKPSLLERIFPNSRKDKIQKRASSAYDFVDKLSEAYDEWLKQLQNNFRDIRNVKNSLKSDQSCLEEYIVAAKMALKGIEKKLEDIEKQKNSADVVIDLDEYFALDKSKEMLERRIENLSQIKSVCDLNRISETTILGTNMEIQEEIISKKSSSIYILALSIVNAMSNAKNAEVLENIKDIASINTELIRENLVNIQDTASLASNNKYNSVVNVNDIVNLVDTLKQSIEQMRKEQDEGMQRLSEATGNLQNFVKELENCTNS